jgi:hypothetical protein
MRSWRVLRLQSSTKTLRVNLRIRTVEEALRRVSHPSGLQEGGQEGPLPVGPFPGQEDLRHGLGMLDTHQDQLVVHHRGGNGPDIVLGRELRLPGGVHDLHGDVGVGQGEGRHGPDLVGAGGAPGRHEEEDLHLLLQGGQHPFQCLHQGRGIHEGSRSSNSRSCS